MNHQITLSNADRAKVRKAITSHPDWREYRETHGLTAAELTSAKCIEVASDLGVDIQAAIDGEDAPEVVLEDAPRVETPEPVKAPEVIAQEDEPGSDDMAQAMRALQTVLGGGTGQKLEALARRVSALEAMETKVLTVDADGVDIGVLPPMRHQKLETLLKVCSSRDVNGYRLNAWLAGPAGSGKTKAASQVAEALGLEFGFHGAMTMEHQLLGFVDAGGTYHPTQFTMLYSKPGLCLLDELDAGSSEALLALNAALANGQMSLPNGEIVKRHPDFVCIGAGNTWGGGATADYIGRAKIDVAFLDRFVRLGWDYDVKLERALSGNEEWARRVQAVRKAAEKHGIKTVISPRATIHGAALIRQGFTPDEAAELTYLAGLTPDQVKMLEG